MLKPQGQGWFLPAIILMKNWASQSLVQSPALRPGSPWHKVGFAALWCKASFLETLCFWYLMIFSQLLFSGKIFFLRQTLSWWLISLEGFTIYSSFLVSDPSASCFSQKHGRKRPEASLFQIHSFALTSLSQNLWSFEERDKNKAVKICRRKKGQHSSALVFILYVEIPSLCCVHLEGNVHWNQRVSVDVTGIRVSLWFVSAQRTIWGQHFALWKGKWCRTVLSPSCRSSNSQAGLYV